MTESMKYPGDYVAGMLLEGQYEILKQNVAAVAERTGATSLPDNAQWVSRFEVPSASSDKTYIVAQRRTDGSWGCGCPAWTRRRTCKHLTTVLNMLADRKEHQP